MCFARLYLDVSIVPWFPVCPPLQLGNGDVPNDRVSIGGDTATTIITDVSAHPERTNI